MCSASIYRSPEGEKKVQELYEIALRRLEIEFEEQMINTRYGVTHTLITGPRESPPLIILQGGNTVNPVTLSWFLPLMKDYRVYAPDTIGHPGRSEQIRISPRDNSFGKWVVDLLDNLGIEKSSFVGPSYGAGIILRTAAYAPERISNAVLLMPSGIANGSLWRMIIKIIYPMFLYRLFPNRSRLIQAIRPMFTEDMDEIAVDVIGSVYRHVKLETQMPRLATREELIDFRAPTLVLAGEKDIFFPANKILPRAKDIIPNLIAAESLQESGHFPSRGTLHYINNRITMFLREYQ
ncbi:alpha/beta fold hydrolase [Chloroflexota bacterium]